MRYISRISLTDSLVRHAVYHVVYLYVRIGPWEDLAPLPSAGMHVPFISGTIWKNTSTIGQFGSILTISQELVYFYFSA